MSHGLEQAKQSFKLRGPSLTVKLSCTWQSLSGQLVPARVHIKQKHLDDRMMTLPKAQKPCYSR